MILINDNAWKLRNALWNISLQKAFESVLVICTTWCSVPIICTTQECPVRAERGRERDLFPHRLFLPLVVTVGLRSDSHLRNTPRSQAGHMLPQPGTGCSLSRCRDPVERTGMTITGWTCPQGSGTDRPTDRLTNLLWISTYSSKNCLSLTWHDVKYLRMRPRVSLSH